MLFVVVSTDDSLFSIFAPFPLRLRLVKWKIQMSAVAMEAPSSSYIRTREHTEAEEGFEASKIARISGMFYIQNEEFGILLSDYQKFRFENYATIKFHQLESSFAEAQHRLCLASLLALFMFLISSYRNSANYSPLGWAKC